MDRTKLDIKSLTGEELAAWLKERGEPAYRARQIYTWLHSRLVTSFDQMTDLPKSLRARLEEECTLTVIRVKLKLCSKLDETVKYLFELPDGQCVEAVLMEYKHGTSLCISTQVGCRMGCAFCASTLGGLVRSLEVSELLEEVYTAQRDSGKRVDSLVLMGIGEPLDNYDNVVKFLRMLSSPQGLNLSLRHVSLSTCGLVDQIDRLAQEKMGLTLSISLHATDNETRSGIMPVNRRWPMEELLAACKRYFAVTGRRVSFEYALIAGVNDSPAQAAQLAKLLGGFGCHVNLIPVNKVKERTINRRSSREAIAAFQQVLERHGINATVRRELGADINAACGQLRREHREEGAADHV